MQIDAVDLVSPLDSAVTAVRMIDRAEVMIAAIIVTFSVVAEALRTSFKKPMALLSGAAIRLLAVQSYCLRRSA